MCKFLLWSVLPFIILLIPLDSSATSHRAPDFTLTSFQSGEEISLHIFQEQGKVVLIDFWATWCGPCEATIPVLKEVNTHFSSDFQLISVDVQWYGGESDDTLSTFIEEKQMDWLIVKDTPDGSTAASYNVTAIPHFFLVDQSGIIQESHVGASITADGLIKSISTLLGKNYQSTFFTDNQEYTNPSQFTENEAFYTKNKEFLETGIILENPVLELFLILGIIISASILLWNVKKRTSKVTYEAIGTSYKTRQQKMNKMKRKRRKKKRTSY